MSIEIGVVLAIAGCLAVLAGLASMRRTRRLVARGVAVWAMAVRVPESTDEGDRRDRIVLQYALDDGRIVERVAPSSPRGGDALEPGRRVLIWYDPADPADVLVFGRDGRRADWAFVAGGLLLIIAGALVAAVGH
jgi:Protein of unknown function (DUF3592)